MVKPAHSPLGPPLGATVRRVPAATDVADAELVLRACEGDHWAEEMLYRRYAESLLGVCSRLVRNAADAEEIVQDAFVDAFEQMTSLREPSAFRHWLTGIAVHKAHRRLRRRKFLRLIGFYDTVKIETLEHSLGADVSPEVHAEIGYLDQALTLLGDKLRIPWQLRYVEGCRLEEVARHCRCSLATAKRRIAEADGKIRQKVDFREVKLG